MPKRSSAVVAGAEWLCECPCEGSVQFGSPHSWSWPCEWPWEWPCEASLHSGSLQSLAWPWLCACPWEASVHSGSLQSLAWLWPFACSWCPCSSWPCSSCPCSSCPWPWPCCSATAALAMSATTSANRTWPNEVSTICASLFSAPTTARVASRLSPSARSVLFRITTSAASTCSTKSSTTLMLAPSIEESSRSSGLSMMRLNSM
mmetsp:Transcript_130868/g.326521  ORF Transcript_130868/g.326521 Transcript_130868/m.326521 type:complete len:204 (-) Transcript_130868:532-1143(-)